MEPMPKLDRDAYVAQLRQQLEAILGQVEPPHVWRTLS